MLILVKKLNIFADLYFFVLCTSEWVKFWAAKLLGKRTGISGSRSWNSTARNLKWLKATPEICSQVVLAGVLALGLLATSCNLFAKVLTPFSRFHMKTIKRTIKFILSRDKVALHICDSVALCPWPYLHIFAQLFGLANILSGPEK